MVDDFAAFLRTNHLMDSAYALTLIKAYSELGHLELSLALYKSHPTIEACEIIARNMVTILRAHPHIVKLKTQLRSFVKEIESISPTSSSLVDAHVILGETATAIELLKTIDNTSFSPLSHVLMHMVANGRAAESITVCHDNIGRFKGLIESKLFISYLKALHDAHLDEMFVVQGLQARGLITREHAGSLLPNLIAYFMDTDRPTIANELYRAFLAAGHQYNPILSHRLLRKAIIEKDEERAIKLTDETFERGHTPSIANLLRLMELFQANKNTVELERLFKQIINGEIFRSPLPKLIVCAQILKSPMANVFIQKLDQLTKDTINVLTSMIIRYYLTVDKYETALEWHLLRLEKYGISMSKYLVANFLAYHRRNIIAHGDNQLRLVIDQRLVKFWEGQRPQHTVDTALETKAQEEFFNSPIQSDLEAIENFNRPGVHHDEQAQNHNIRALKKPSLSVPEQRLVAVMIECRIAPQERQLAVASPEERQLADQTLDRLYIELAKCLRAVLRTGAIPRGSILLEATTMLNEYSTEIYQKTMAEFPHIRSMVFGMGNLNRSLHSDLNNTIESLAKENMIVYALVHSVWNHIALGLLGAKNLPLTIKVVSFIMTNNITLSFKAADQFAGVLVRELERVKVDYPSETIEKIAKFVASMDWGQQHSSQIRFSESLHTARILGRIQMRDLDTAQELYRERPTKYLEGVRVGLRLFFELYPFPGTDIVQYRALPGLSNHRGYFAAALIEYMAKRGEKVSHVINTYARDLSTLRQEDFTEILASLTNDDKSLLFFLIKDTKVLQSELVSHYTTTTNKEIRHIITQASIAFNTPQPHTPTTAFTEQHILKMMDYYYHFHHTKANKIKSK
eukprot:gene17253-20559_t